MSIWHIFSRKYSFRVKSRKKETKMKNKVIESNLLYRAREYALKNGKDALLHPEIQLGIIAVTYNELIDLNKETYTKNKIHILQESGKAFRDFVETYFLQNNPEIGTKSLVENMAYLAANIHNIYPKYQKLFQYVYDNFGKTVYDTGLNDDEKKLILKNTLVLFQEELNAIKQDDEYGEYLEYEKSIQLSIDEYKSFNKEREKYGFGTLSKDECLKKCYDDYLSSGKEALEECKKHIKEKSTAKLDHKLMNYVIDSLEQKIDDTQERNTILQSMSDIGTNYITTYQGKTFYPIMFDILSDVANVEFHYFLDKVIIQKNIGGVWKEAQTAQERRGFYTQNTFYRLEFINDVGYQNLRSYILYEYANLLQDDIKKVQKLFSAVLYNSVNSKKSPAIKPQGFDNVKSRRFLMENTKMILGKI